MPADKSIAHRALILAALADGRSQILLRAPGADLGATATGLEALGARISREPLASGVRIVVDGLGDESGLGRLEGGSADCGNSGTTMRLLAGAAAFGRGTVGLAGDASLSRRPMERVAAPLRRMGAEVHTTEGHGPLAVAGRHPLRALEHDMPVASAQVLGAIALAALAADGPTAIRSPGPTRDHTERMLRSMGADVSRSSVDGATVTTLAGPARLSPLSIDVPGDPSSAAPWIVAATLHPAAEIRVDRVGLNPTRTALIDALRAMGGRIEAAPTTEHAGEPVGDLVVRSAGPLRPISIGPRDAAALIDELPLLAVVMAAAGGTSEVRGAAELRLKESDRIAAMAAALHAAGARVEELPDGWRIGRGRPRHARVATGGDHRVAMAMAVAAWSGVAAGVELDDPDCVAVSYSSFWSDARGLGAAA